MHGAICFVPLTSLGYESPSARRSIYRFSRSTCISQRSDRIRCSTQQGDSPDADNGYDLMTTIFGPPKQSRRSSSRPDQSTAKRRTGEDDTNTDSESFAGPKPALTSEEEYALFESILMKTGGTGVKPQKGAKRWETMESVAEALQKKPTNGHSPSHNVKDPGTKRQDGPKKKSSFQRPAVLSLTNEEIEESYRNLERFLDIDGLGNGPLTTTKEGTIIPRKKFSKPPQRPENSNDGKGVYSSTDGLGNSQSEVASSRNIDDLERPGQREILRKPPLRDNESSTRLSNLKEAASLGTAANFNEPEQAQEMPVLKLPPKRLVGDPSFSNDTPRRTQISNSGGVVSGAQDQTLLGEQSSPRSGLSTSNESSVAGESKHNPDSTLQPKRPRAYQPQSSRRMNTSRDSGPVFILTGPKLLKKIEDVHGSF